MFIRIRAVLIIVLVNLIIILFAVFAGIISVQNRIATSQEEDLMLVADIADHFLSSEIENVKLKTSVIAERISELDGYDISAILDGLGNQYPEFAGMAIIDAEGTVTATAGRLPAGADIITDTYIRKAFLGDTVISSTVKNGNGVVFYLAAPVPRLAHISSATLPPDTVTDSGKPDRILLITLPGAYFNDRLSAFYIWDTGHIFISDADGYAISNARLYWVDERFNYVRSADNDPSYTKFAETAARMIAGESGMGYYSIADIPRACSFRPVSGSSEGWSLGVVAPLPESPFRDIDMALVTVGLVSLILSVIAACIASNYLKKPFEEIAALKEKAEESSKSKSDFLANMSHEIRTPMNAILGITEILLTDGTLTDDVSVALNKVYNSGDMLLNILNDILDLSKIEAGKLELISARYELASLINDSVVLNMMRKGSKPVEFVLEVDAKLPEYLNGDELRIKQILNNLLSNAFKYTPKGTVTLAFTCRERADGQTTGVTLEIKVSDTGIGMTKEQTDTLFEEYTRFIAEANRTTDGTGLGMSITRSLLMMMDGQIFVESEPGKGSVFTVLIPQKREGSGVIGQELADKLHNFQSNGVRQLKKANILYEPMPYGKILVVDDVESNLFVTKGLMASYELNIDTATDGYQAVDKVMKGNVYDIIFMDHMMPGMDGMEATKLIREHGYTAPIVALSANAIVGQMDVFLANGFDDFISKPIDARHLNSVLKKYVRDRQAPEVVAAVRNRISEDYEEVFSSDPSISPQLAELFIRDAHKAISELENIAKKRGGYDEKDVSAYISSVHAMVGALANVNAKELSETASRMERVVREGKSTIVYSELQSFITELRRLIFRFIPHEDEEPEEENADLNYLYEHLQIVQQACDNFDRQVLKDTIIQLRQRVWPTYIKESLGAMALNLLSGDYDELARAAKKLDESTRADR